ncbi:MAG: rhodanese-like domain-containing protein [Methylococcales bacterium]
MYQQNSFFCTFVLLFVFFSPVMADLKGIEPTDLETMIKQGVPVIDIRTADEWKATGIIPSSHKLTFFQKDGKSDPQQWLMEFKEIVPDSDQKFVLVCRSGGRTGVVGQFLSDKIGMKNVLHLEHGIVSWMQQSKPVTR